MGLPNITSMYSVFLESVDKNVRFRPYTVAEEKMLLTAVESKDPSVISNVLKEISFP